MSYDYESYDEPLTGGSNMEFSDKSIRHGFIRKVYLLLMSQLVVTFGMVAVFTLSSDVKAFVQSTPAILYVAIAGSLVCIIALSCCGDVRRRTPCNYIFLGIFTLCEGWLLGSISATYTHNEIMLAVGICAVVTLSLTIFACQTKYDFTGFGTYLFVGLVVLLLFGILAIFIHNKITQLIYGCLGALLFSFYLVFDTQLIIGGKHKYSISPEEYVFAALNLYLDIINIFLFVLQIIRGSRS